MSFINQQSNQVCYLICWIIYIISTQEKILWFWKCTYGQTPRPLWLLFPLFSDVHFGLSSAWSYFGKTSDARGLVFRRGDVFWGSPIASSMPHLTHAGWATSICSKKKKKKGKGGYLWLVCSFPCLLDKYIIHPVLELRTFTQELYVCAIWMYLYFTGVFLCYATVLHLHITTINTKYKSVN